MKRKASFTLIEVLICVALIAFILSGGAIAIPKFLSAERFEHEVKRVEEKIALVQELILDCETSISLVFENNVISLVSQKPLPKRWVRPSKRFREIEEISFEGELTDRLELIFDGEMGGCPRGELTLRGKKRSATLFLPGYPGKIKRGREAFYAKNAPYPQELISRH